MNDTRTCPYCAEEVRAAAIKCKHCGSMLSARYAPGDWYRSSRDRMIAGVCGGLAQQFGVPATVTTVSGAERRDVTVVPVETRQI